LLEDLSADPCFATKAPSLKPIETNSEQKLVRGAEAASRLEALRRTVVANRDHIPVTVNDVAEVGISNELRTAVATRDDSETVLGTAMMLIGENSRTASQRVGALRLCRRRARPEREVRAHA